MGKKDDRSSLLDSLFMVTTYRDILISTLFTCFWYKIKIILSSQKIFTVASFPIYFQYHFMTLEYN